jgi:cardiolipin synthase
LTQFELLVGADAFWRRAAQDFAAAQRRLLVQAMTFEGDSAGLGVAAAIADSGAADRRVLVDAYSRHVISDRITHGPASWFDKDFRTEIHATHDMFRHLSTSGVGVRVTNPVGPLFVRYPARNHKKLIVADDVAYLGGINFSDHNFAWHDFMLRLEGAEAADALATDFAATWSGAPRAQAWDLPGLRLHSLDGRNNAVGFRPVMDLIAGALRSVTVISPYLTFPFTDALAAAQARGAAVTLITPLSNNKPMVRDYLLLSAQRAGFQVRLMPHMTHLKGMVIDDQHLIVGSSNFDFVSLAAEEELVAVISDPAVIAAFNNLVVAPALAEALPHGAHTPSVPAGERSEAILRVVAGLVGASRNARRTAIDWT